jgi:tRNA dimethylallyltransferase
MASVATVTPLIVILGPTASGKSAMALALAEQFEGEIIAADSRTVYKGMDIGTAKPTFAERQRVPHHLIDVAFPDERFTVSDFKRMANEAIRTVGNRGHIPFLVGGSGLYIDAVIYDFGFRKEATLERRSELEKLSVLELQAALRKLRLPLPTNAQNPRHLVRALETEGEVSKRGELRRRTLVIGLDVDAERLRTRVTGRVDTMVANGLVGEVRRLSTRYGWATPALQATGYRAFRSYIEGEATLEEAKAKFVQNDMRYAKRQKTWFKRNKSIHWISKTEDAVDLITTFLNK